MTRQGDRAELIGELVRAGHALAAEGLVTAFGHVTARLGTDRLLITPPVPLGSLRPDMTFTELPVGADELPPGTPREAWIHTAVAAARPDAGAICRAQPSVATAVTAADLPIRPLHGQGAFCDARVPVFDDAVLVRERARGIALAQRLTRSPVLVMRGNGAVTVGRNVGEAVALMWVLEASARMNRDAASAGRPRPLPDDEQEAWRSVAPELLDRIWAYLCRDPKEESR